TPIFESISHVYNAIFLTSSTSAMLERLSIDIQSTEAEQQTAVNKLKEVFIRLKGDDSLTSHAGIEKMSDRFAKLLLVNSFLFPRTRGSLALKAFLGSEELRKIAASIIQDIPPPGTRFEDNQIQSLAAHVISFFEQAALSDELRNGNSIPVSLSALQDDLATLAPLLKDDSQRDLIFSGLNAAKAIIPAFIGKDAEHLNARDLGFLVHKSLDLYFTWVPSTPKGLNEQIGASLDILLREPGINIVGQSEMVTAVESIKKVMFLLKMDSKIDWDLLLAFIPKGMRLKSILFQNSDSSISSYEISQIAYLYDPFRRNDDISVAIAATANLLANRPFAEVQFEDLLPAIEVFLPKGQTLASLGINAKVLGDAKFILIGGGKSSIKPPEYATLARAFSALLSKVGSKLKNLPKNFQPGFNSPTVDLAGGFLEGFMAARTSDLPMNDLKPLILDLARQAGFKLRERTVDKFLIGFNTRILNQSKDTKPNSLNQLVLKTPQLKVFLPLIESIKAELADLESAYAGIDVKTTTLSRTVLLSRLKNSQNRLVTEKINPLLDGDTHLHHFPKKGDKNNQFYEYDLAYKAVIQSVLTWIMPFYQLEEDYQPNLIRLSLFDLTDLLSDINELVFDLRLSFSNTEPSITAVARMQNMNLFTQVGNGDKYMDLLEGTEFLTITSGGKVLLGKIQDKLFPKCFPGITDYTTVKSISYACLSEVFFSKEYVKEIYTPVIPQLVDQYLKWNPQQLETYRQAAFTATRPGWTESGSLDMADFESLISLPYFLENVFERFDLDQDDTLRFSELMSAFPIFCGEINAAAGGKLKGSCVPGEAPGQIEAVYGYLLFYGHPPTGMERGNTVWTRVRSTAAVLSWFRFWRNLDRDPQVRDREAPMMERQDMLSIISNLAASTAEIEATPELALEIPE
ncbi:MAG: hypothetical protein H7333_08790, partial [Bdellovibrionales bacterium]|nr:hypothetical protein [Oligoflexia bacterium]